MQAFSTHIQVYGLTIKHYLVKIFKIYDYSNRNWRYCHTVFDYGETFLLRTIVVHNGLVNNKPLILYF